MLQFVRLLLSDFANLLFPTLCLSCRRSLEANEPVLCTACRVHLPETGQHRDPYNSAFLNKFAENLPLQFVVSYLQYTKGGIVQRLIHQIKYKGQKEAAKVIGGWYGHQLKTESDLTDKIDVLIGVPLHRSRFNQRGYNQTDWIAEGLSESLGVPMRTDVLIRQRFKTSQTRKGRMERWENVKTVFAVANAEDVRNKNVVIVDDVLTTGATVEACAVQLHKAGCRSIGVITIAATHR